MMLIPDTNVVSELRKILSGKADENVAKWTDGVVIIGLYLSAITVHELEIGVLLSEHGDPTHGAKLRVLLNNHVLPAFTNRILSIETAVAQCSARLYVPDPCPVRDTLIAATAFLCMAWRLRQQM
jgi:predicted nucleic acid-binding protein